MKTSDKPTLAEHLGRVQLGKLVRKKFLGGYQVPLLQFLPVGLWLFNEGAVFGRARRDKLEIMAKMFFGLEATAVLFASLGLSAQLAKNEQWILECLRKVGPDGLLHYRNNTHKEPESLMDLWLTSFAPSEVDFRDISKIKMITDKKIRLGDALRQSDAWLFAGISFGALFPDLLEKMWRQSYEIVEQKSWADARRAGVDIPEEFLPLPLEEMEQTVLVDVAAYTREYFPELVDLLSLRF